MQSGIGRFVGPSLAAAAVVLGVAVPWSCAKSGVRATAAVVGSRSELIGGPDALGDVGDFKLSNGKVRFVIQGTDRSVYSRGWGVYAGALLDADLVRPEGAPSSVARGNDRFGELFPALFLEAVKPDFVEIPCRDPNEPDATCARADGSDGGPAKIVVQGRGEPFLTLARNLIDIALAPASLTVRTTYSLGPEDQFLTISTEVRDDSLVGGQVHKFPAGDLLGVKLAIPFGNVLLFGARNEVFVAGAGFDLRHSLEDAFKAPPRLPALNGLATDLIATRSEGVSYGFATRKFREDDPAAEGQYVWRNRALIPNAATNSMLVPFYASSFTGAFTAQPPDELTAENPSFTYTNYLIVGSGDVGSVRDVQLEIERAPTGTFTAMLLEKDTGKLVPNASLVVLDEQRRPYSQYTPDAATGRVVGRLPKGRYYAVVVTDHRHTTGLNREIPFDVRPGQAVEILQRTATAGGAAQHSIEVPRNAIVNVRVHQSSNDSLNGRAIPAKVTVVGETPPSPAFRGREPREYLYDLAVGERMRPTDGIPDADDSRTRQFVERVLLAGADGLASGELKPGRYVFLVSRGPEYDSVRLGAPDGPLVIEAGRTYDFEASLTRVVDTPGWVSADFHVHTANSIDGSIPLDERVLSYAAEGVEFLAATDHNFVTDLQPNVDALRLQDFVHGITGLEMTTLEMGHFNAFPIQHHPGSVRHGPFTVAGGAKEGRDSTDPMDWVDLPPRELFQTMRAFGTDGSTVIQVNHPRDSILGYFSDFNVSADTGLPRQGNLIASPNGAAFGPDKFSWKFDAMEVFNGKRFEMLRTYRMPQTLPPGEHPDLPIGPGEIVREACPAPPEQPKACNPENPKTCSDLERCNAETKVCECDYAKQEVAYPGAIDDWFHLLNLAGRPAPANADLEGILEPVTGTGNSDSHGLYFEEAGSPRNWVRVRDLPSGEESPRRFTPEEIALAVKQHKVVFSNGPFIDVTADGSAHGQERKSSVGGLLTPVTDKVVLGIDVKAPPWVRVDRVIVFVDGAEQKRIELRGPQASRTKRCCDQGIELKIDRDAWIVVSAEGDESLFPYLTPLEQAPLQVSDAIAAIAGPLGLGGNGLGVLRPPLTGPVTPFAMTNPIWIDRDGPGGTPDGVSFGRGRDAILSEGESGLVAPGVRPIGGKRPEFPEVAKGHEPVRSSDLRRLFRHWGGHGHAH